MSQTVLIRPQPEIGPSKAAIYHLGDREEMVAEGPGGTETGLKDYIRGKLERELAEGNRNVILDLASVEWIDSVYVGVILSWQNLINEHDGELVLVNLSNRSEEVLKVANLDLVLNVKESVSDALRHFTDSAS